MDQRAFDPLYFGHEVLSPQLKPFACACGTSWLPPWRRGASREDDAIDGALLRAWDKMKQALKESAILLNFRDGREQ